MGLYFAAGFHQSLSMLSLFVILMRQAEPRLRGRVMGVFSMAFTGLMPYAALILAAGADVVGFSRMLQSCAVLYAALGFTVLARVPVPDVRAPEPEAAVAG